MDHNKVAKRIADAVGKDNIVAAAHCATRLRLVIKDVKKINQMLMVFTMNLLKLPVLSKLQLPI